MTVRSEKNRLCYSPEKVAISAPQDILVRK